MCSCSERSDSFNYVFGSEEYQEYVGTAFNDIFGFYLNDYNLATVPETSGSPVSVNNINQDENAEYYVDNLPGTYQIEPDGFTTTLQAKGSLVPGFNRMKLAIADTSDYILDSRGFLLSKVPSNASLRHQPPVQLGRQPAPQLLAPPTSQSLLATVKLDLDSNVAFQVRVVSLLPGVCLRCGSFHRSHH
jgi:hypothetical protein